MASHAAGAKRPPSLLLARWVLFVGGVYLLLLGLLVSVWGASKAWVPHRGFGGHVFDAPELGLPAEAGGARVQDTRAVSTEAPNRETAAPRDSADGEGAAMCPVSASGAKCLSPYQHEGSWRTGCFNGTCPTELALEGGTRGQFEECVMAPCADVARGTKTPSSPHPRRRPRRAAAGSEDGGSSSDAAADPPSVDPNFCESEFDTCPCTPLVTYQCGKVRHANCTDACDAYLRYLSRPPSFPTLHSPNADLCSKLFDSWRAFAPARPEDVGRLRNYTAPPFDEVKRHFAGTGIVIASGGRRLPSAIALALFIRNVLKSTLPIEIWLAEDEPPPSTDMLFILHAHDVTFFQLTEDCGYFRFRWTKRWTRGEKNVMSDSEGRVVLKALVAALTSFDTVIYLDDDAFPVVDPVSFLPLLGDDSAVFFRDLWGMYADASIWSVLAIPRTPMPAQDSGVFLVRKSGSNGNAWAALATTGYMNYHHLTFYPALYHGSFATERNGHVAIGAGDKDTFQVGWIARGEKYRMMGPVVFVGSAGRQCGNALGQRGEDGKMLVVHMNGMKLKYKSFAAGTWERLGSRVFSLDRLFVLHNEAWANSFDGRARSLVSWRYVEPYHSYCASFKAQNTQPLRRHLTYDFKIVFTSHVKSVFSLPWVGKYYATSEASVDTEKQFVARLDHQNRIRLMQRRRREALHLPRAWSPSTGAAHDEDAPQ